jgi:hypothetical protein
MRIVGLLLFALCAACSTVSPKGETHVAPPQGNLSECLSWANAGAKSHRNLWRGNLSECLYWASADAKGTRLCGPKKREEYRSQFERRYGNRVRALMKAHEARHARDGQFIVTSSCRLWPPGSEADMDEWHARAMNDFDKWLAAAERRKP